MFPLLNMKCHVYSDSMPLKWITGQTNNRATSSSNIESWWHTTYWTAPHHHKHGIARGVHHISYVNLCKMPCSNLQYYTKLLTSDMHSPWGYASQTPREPRSRVGAHSGKHWPSTGNWAKSGGWALFREWALFLETMVCYISVTVWPSG